MRAPYSRVIADLVDEVAERHPDRQAVLSLSDSLTYDQLSTLGARTAAGLAALGVVRHDRVGLLCTNRPEWLRVLLGANRLGAAVAAFDTWSRAWDLEHLLGNSSACVLVTLDSFGGHRYVEELRRLVPELDRHPPGVWRSSRFPALREVVVIGDDVPMGARPFEELDNGERTAGPPGSEAAAGDVAFVLYTSGSTARPKGVPLVNHAAIENGFNIGERMLLGGHDRVWLSAPLFWSYGSANALMATLTHEATLVLQAVFEPREALDLIETHGCTVAYTLPTMTTALTAHPSFSPARTASLRTGLTIGTSEDVRRAAEVLGIDEICNVYGSTETYGNCCVTSCDLPLEVRLQCQGPPLPGMRVRIVDSESGSDLPAGWSGDVLVAGYVAFGYVGSDELTRQAFTPDGYYRTGDVGYLDADGRFHFVARASEMIKIRGINVSPLEVESFLLTHPAVRAAAVVGRPHPEAGQIAVAYVELVETGTIDAEELPNYCRSGMAAYKAPAEVVIVEELPKTDTGKLDRRALREAAGFDPQARLR